MRSLPVTDDHLAAKTHETKDRPQRDLDRFLLIETQLCCADGEVCVPGLPAQIIQAYPGQAALTQQQQKSLDSGRGQAAEEHAAFASLAGFGKQASAAQNASEVPQQVPADVATLPRAPVEQGGYSHSPSY